MDGNLIAIEKLRPKRTEVTETMYPMGMEQPMDPNMQPGMDVQSMNPAMPNGAPNQVMPGELGVDPTGGRVFTPGVGWTKYGQPMR